MRNCVVAAAMVGVSCLGASSGRASELVFTDDSAFVAALGGVVLTVDESGTSRDDVVTDLLRLVDTRGECGILWDDVDLRGDASSLSSLIQVPAADLDHRAVSTAK